jgi:hypothetical protein
MFDVFYSGTEPNLFAHERHADNIEHAQQLSRTRFFWWINYLTDYRDWDFLWEPAPWQAHQRHAWPSQWQTDSGTYLVPRQGYTETNYRTDQLLRRLSPCGPGSTAIIEIDHQCDNRGQIPGTVKTVRYFDNYKDTLTRIANTVDSEYAWICSSVCDYSNFDFSWHPDPWQLKLLHVFASDGEKFGDTFYMHVPSFKQRIAEFDLLDWYDLNFVVISVPRRPLPRIVHNHDTHVTAVKTLDWPGPLAVFSTTDNIVTVPTVPLWREKTKTVVPLSSGASQVVVPKTCVPHIRSQLYDYPYIDRTQRHMYTDTPLDIVFIDNGEPNADENWKVLEWAYKHPRTNRLHRSSGVKGRVAAYKAAAELSTTPWFFAVFAKLHIDNNFDWSWQPDRMQQPKHYIFHARNPVNGLEYGHMSTIAYNKKLVLENTAPGLDFTLDQEHEVVPILSGTANYHYDMWTCWRTAFRECIKLKDSLPDVENEYRLNQWLTKDNTEGQWSKKGATDAVEYYDAVKGEFSELKKSYDWAWLNSYAMLKYGSMWNRL